VRLRRIGREGRRAYRAVRAVPSPGVAADVPCGSGATFSCGAAMSHLAIHRLRVGFDADQLVLGFAIRALEGQFATTTLPTALERRRRRRAKLPEFAA
jgi:hypothetical protein